MPRHGLTHSLMGRLFQWLQAQAGPKLRQIDLSLGLPAVPRLATQHEAEQFEHFEQTFAQLTVDERFVALSVLAQNDFCSDALDAWISSSNSFIAPLFKGTSVLYRAWQVRDERVTQNVNAFLYLRAPGHAPHDSLDNLLRQQLAVVIDEDACVPRVLRAA